MFLDYCIHKKNAKIKKIKTWFVKKITTKKKLTNGMFRHTCL